MRVTLQVIIDICSHLLRQKSVISCLHSFFAEGLVNFEQNTRNNDSRQDNANVLLLVSKITKAI